MCVCDTRAFFTSIPSTFVGIFNEMPTCMITGICTKFVFPYANEKSAQTDTSKPLEKNCVLQRAVIHLLAVFRSEIKTILPRSLEINLSSAMIAVAFVPLDCTVMAYILELTKITHKDVHLNNVEFILGSTCIFFN